MKTDLLAIEDIISKADQFEFVNYTLDSRRRFSILDGSYPIYDLGVEEFNIKDMIASLERSIRILQYRSKDPELDFGSYITSRRNLLELLKNYKRNIIIDNLTI